MNDDGVCTQLGVMISSPHAGSVFSAAVKNIAPKNQEDVASGQKIFLPEVSSVIFKVSNNKAAAKSSNPPPSPQPPSPLFCSLKSKSMEKPRLM